MLDLLASLAVLLVVTALALALLAAVTVAPFVRAVDMAEQRGFSPVRWGIVALATSGLGGVMLLIPLFARTAASLVWVPLGALVAWLAVGVLALLEPDQTSIGGVQGAHER